MRYVIIALAALFVLSVSCGNDDPKEDPTSCESAALVEAQALEAACTEDATCVFCDCASQGLMMATTGDGTELSYECVENTATCDATAADACIADEVACLDGITLAMESACASSVPAE